MEGQRKQTEVSGCVYNMIEISLVVDIHPDDHTGALWEVFLKSAFILCDHTATLIQHPTDTMHYFRLSWQLSVCQVQSVNST